jgi:ribonuclease G
VNEQILINVTPQETRVAVTEQGAVQELHIERGSSRGIVGNIYLGRVCRVLPGMQSAFVEIGLPRAAFLHVADIWMARNGAAERPIEKILSEGQTLLVQVVKDPIGSKGARLSTRSRSPGACWSTCRRIRTSASRSASRTRPSASTCAKRSIH